MDLDYPNDFLLIYDGETPSSSVLARLSANFSEPQLIITSQSHAYIYFHSNFIHSGRGFSLTYKRGFIYIYYSKYFSQFSEFQNLSSYFL